MPNSQRLPASLENLSPVGTLSFFLKVMACLYGISGRQTRPTLTAGASRTENVQN